MIKPSFFLITVLLLIASCTDQPFYTLEDYSSVPKADVHIHIRSERNAFVEQAIKDNFKFGYSYESFNTGVANFDNGTHDLQLALIFGEKKNKGKLNLVQKTQPLLSYMLLKELQKGCNLLV